jgi:hypothetical protein
MMEIVLMVQRVVMENIHLLMGMYMKVNLKMRNLKGRGSLFINHQGIYMKNDLKEGYGKYTFASGNVY